MSAWIELRMGRVARGVAAVTIAISLPACTAFVELLAPDESSGSGCAADAECPTPTEPCLIAVCGGDGTCSTALAAAGTECGDGGVCDDAGSCVATQCNSTAQDGDETDVDCGGSCDPCEVGQGCGVDEDCLSDNCDGEVCAPGVGAPGEPCDDGVECASGSCTDGVCCASACDGACESCDQRGEEGTCLPYADGEDPEQECGADVCNGASACRCNDGAVNGFETDVDCGGVCDGCPDGAGCAVGSDCTSGVCEAMICQVAMCGDGVVNGTDECDGNGIGVPGLTPQCDLDCTFSSCGDGVVNSLAQEQCDGDGAGLGGETATCDLDCTFAMCGDGTVNTTALEACDGDGQGDPGETSTCDIDCSFQLCGDGVVNVTAGEGCDGDGLGNGGETMTCDLNCTPQQCGDGTINLTANEQCDGNGFGMGGETSQCDLDCTLALCGDSTTNVTSGESCDDGGQVSYDGCASTCRDPVMHLLLTETVTTPNADAFVEIYNPSLTAVDLTDVYLADDPSYYLVTTGGGTPGAADFRVRFPNGSSIAAGAFAVISLESATSFNSAYGSLPDFDFDPTDALAPAMLGAADVTPSLDAAAEPLILFTWDGVSDLVSDIDYLVYGDVTNAVDKSGVSVGASTYQDDTLPGAQDVVTAPSAGAALHRCDTSEGVEIVTGGNGTLGHNETSEDLSVTWAEGVTSPGAVPTAGVCGP